MCITGQPSSAAMVNNKDGISLKWNRANDPTQKNFPIRLMVS